MLYLREVRQERSAAAVAGLLNTPSKATPMRTFRLALAQINPTVGDLEDNASKIIDYIDRARSYGADLVAFPELAIPGYTPEDLLFKAQFVEANIDTMRRIAQASARIAVVVGFADSDGGVRNAAAVAYGGRVVDTYHKIHLPNYGVFDERRYFTPGNRCPVYSINGTLVGVNVCEDIWEPVGPTNVQCASGAEVIVNISGSPFYAGRLAEREQVLATRASDHDVFVAYLNLVGGQDELVFDGGSMVFDPAGGRMAQGSRFVEELIVVDLDVEALSKSRREPAVSGEELTAVDSVGRPSIIEVSDYSNRSRPAVPTPEPVTCDGIAEVYAALRTGTRDYVHKTGFEKVLVALSGGIDSSLVATIAVDSLGSENVTGVWMPSRYSSERSMRDARELADNLSIRFETLAIEDAFTANLETLAPLFDGLEPGLAEENLQSRIRGVMIMALSNKFGWLVLTTGNKSEMAVGYATIYGDMAGGFAVINDVPKTLVYELAEYRNSITDMPPIPTSVIEKPPTAELRPDQLDQDSLPPYEVLDPILKAYVEDDLSFELIVEKGFAEEVVRRTITMVDRSEYKRRQAPPGIKITPRNFGRDRRMPIANRYRPF